MMMVSAARIWGRVRAGSSKRLFRPERSIPYQKLQFRAMARHSSQTSWKDMKPIQAA